MKPLVSSVAVLIALAMGGCEAAGEPTDRSDAATSRSAADAAGVAGPASAQVTPAAIPSVTRQFRDWTVVCNNVNTCVAYSQAGEFGEGWVRIEMRAGPNAQPEVSFGAWPREGSGQAGLRIDDRAVAARAVGGEDGTYQVQDARAALAAMAAGQAALLTVPGIDSPATLSLDGISATLLWIDDRQGRLGTPGALIRRGTRPEAEVPASPVATAPRPGPQVAQTGLPARPSEALIRFVRAQACEEGDARAADLGLSAVARLSPTTILWSRQCASGAYNFAVRYFLTDAQGAAPRVLDLPRTPQPGEDQMSAEDRALVYNSAYGPATRELSTFAKDRGLGDCGYAATWVWTGDRFVLSDESSMGICAGMDPSQWPRTWVTAPG